jgi:tetratricopeptide (TPR) repeat protein
MAEDTDSKQTASGNSIAQADQGSAANVFNPTLNVNVQVPSSAAQPISPTGTDCSSPQYALFPIWYVPYPKNQYFVGRTDILQHLHEAFRAGKATTLALYGLGGIGKTQTAIEYTYRYQNEYQAILLARADLHETLVSDFVTFAGLLGLPEKDAQEQSFAVNAVKRWLEQHERWLLIFDNADNIAIIRNFLPLTHKGHVLLTTRTAALGKLAQPVEIEKMTPEEGALFLLHRTNILKPETSLESINMALYSHAKNISQVMDGLPLALEQAGAYIEEMGCGLSDYLHLYQDRHAILLQWHSELDFDQTKTVATTWSLSFEKVKLANPAAAELLKFFSFLHPDSIPEELINSGSPHLGYIISSIADDPIQLNLAIRELRKYSLVRRTPDNTALTIHRLVQMVLKDEMDTGQQHQWAERTVRALNQAFPKVEFTTWSQCQRYLPHAQLCIGLIEQWNMTFPEAARLLNVVGHYLYERANYAEAEPLLHRSLAICEQMLGTDHPDVAESLNNLVALYRLQGKYNQAIPYCERALSIRKQTLGENHPDVALSLNNLARLYHHLGKYAQAEALHEQALAIRKQTLGESHPAVAQSLNNLAGLYLEWGKYAHSAWLYRQTLELSERTLGTDHINIATSLDGLALLYYYQKKYVLAEQHLEWALTIREKTLDSGHPDVADNLKNLALLYRTQGNYHNAKTLYERALTCYKRTLVPEHPKIANAQKDYTIVVSKIKQKGKRKR